MNANEDVERTIAQQASEWVTALSRGANTDELAAFGEWIRTSPRHVRDFLLMAGIERELRFVDTERRFGKHELSEAANTSNVATLKGRDHPASAAFTSAGEQNGRYGVSRRVGLAASVAAIIIASIVWWRPGVFAGWERYATATGEQRTVELADGSIVHLNTRSRIEVRMSKEGRSIRLRSGEALFKVHPDSTRAFRVLTDDATIVAIGTQFNVYRRPEGTRVAVIEGKVQISSAIDQRPSGILRVPTPLVAGEEARVDGRGDISKRATVDLSNTVAWQQRRLMFQASSLSDMIAEFNRYNRTPQFRLADSTVASRHYTGVFDADDPESLLQLLMAEPDLAISKAGNEILVRKR